MIVLFYYIISIFGVHCFVIVCYLLFLNNNNNNKNNNNDDAMMCATGMLLKITIRDNKTCPQDTSLYNQGQHAVLHKNSL